MFYKSVCIRGDYPIQSTITPKHCTDRLTDSHG